GGPRPLARPLRGPSPSGGGGALCPGHRPAPGGPGPPRGPDPASEGLWPLPPPGQGGGPPPPRPEGSAGGALGGHPGGLRPGLPLGRAP
ncbi:hypothetical protein ABTC85_20750, partial [Acinetobacter baumannii]